MRRATARDWTPEAAAAFVHAVNPDQRPLLLRRHERKLVACYLMATVPLLILTLTGSRAGELLGDPWRWVVYGYFLAVLAGSAWRWCSPKFSTLTRMPADQPPFYQLDHEVVTRMLVFAPFAGLTALAWITDGMPPALAVPLVATLWLIPDIVARLVEPIALGGHALYHATRE